MSQKITVQDGNLTFDALTGEISLTSGTNTDDGNAINLTSSDSGGGATGTGGAVTITSGTGVATEGSGGNIVILAGAGAAGAGSTAVGGDIILTAGAMSGAQDGSAGDIDITAGANTATFGLAGTVDIKGGTNSQSGSGGTVQVLGGSSTASAGTGGAVSLKGGTGSSSGAGSGGSALVEGGTVGGVGGSGGAVTIRTLPGNGVGAGGVLALSTGNGGTTGAGGDLTLTSGKGGITSGVTGNIVLQSGASGLNSSDDGGTISLTGGNAGASGSGDGGPISLTSGAGAGTGAGGDFILEVGAGGAPGPGTSGNFFVNTTTGANAAAGLQVPIPGLVSIYGIGRSGSGPAGNLELWGGYAAGAGGGSIGGDAIIWGGGQGGGAGEGGNAMLIGGESDTQPGDAVMIGGVATTAGNGGQANVTGGAGFGTNQAGGSTTVKGGLGIGTGDGGAANLRGGNSGSGATGIGGSVAVVGGLSGAMNGDGGAVTLQTGDGAGSGDDGVININIGSTGEFRIDAVQGIHATNSAGPATLNEAASSTNPTLIPNKADLDTGIGWSAADALSLVVGGIEAVRLEEASSHVIVTNKIDAAVVASTTQTQGQRPLISSYNVVVLVPNDNDVVTMPPAAEGKTVTIVNRDIRILQVFPASGDTLEAGVNVSVTMPPQSSRTFVGSAGTSIYSTISESLTAGGGASSDVTKVGTPVDNEIGVWTGDGTIEGDTNLQWDGTNLALTGTTHLVLPLTNDAATPVLAFGDGDTGFFETFDDTLHVSIAGTARFVWADAGNSFQGLIIGAGAIRNEATAATNPTVVPSNADTDTGLGRAAANQLSLITGGIESTRITGAIVQTTDATVTEIIGIPVVSGEGFGFEIHVMGTQDSTGDTVFERVFGAIRNQGGTTALVGSTVTDRTDDAGATTWTIAIAADDTTDELTVDVTGEAAHTIDWKIRVHLLNV